MVYVSQTPLSQREREVYYRATADKTLEKKRRERDARFVHIVLRRIYIYIYIYKQANALAFKGEKDVIIVVPLRLQSGRKI